MTHLCEWGLSGLEALYARVSVIVIVDVISFSTAVDIAVAKGGEILPYIFNSPEGAAHAAAAQGALLARRRESAGDGFSLSPGSFLRLQPGTRVLLPSPNGATLSLAGGRDPARVQILAGCLRNATAVAARARAIAGAGAIAVIPAGEKWRDGTLRPAIEDLIGAGAILDRLGGDGSPEAQIARDAYRSARPDLAALLRACVSGQELIARGYGEDVELALAEDVSTAAPILRDGLYRAA